MKQTVEFERSSAQDVFGPPVWRVAWGRVLFSLFVVGQIGFDGWAILTIESNRMSAESQTARRAPHEAMEVKQPPNPFAQFDPSTAIAERVEVEPPFISDGYQYGVSYDGQKGTKWIYIGGNPARRGAWRVSNQRGEMVMPRPTPGMDADSLYTGSQWTDVLGVAWKYNGTLDQVGDPVVYSLNR
jgi:hypothetical protein